MPILDLYFRYAWPAFLALAALACFVFLKSVASTEMAFVSAILFAVGSNLAYAAGWFFPLSNWDDVILSHNFQGAGAEVLLYNNWTPALVAMFAALYAVHASVRQSGWGWPVLAGVTFAATVLSKPWIFACIMAALCIVILASRRDRIVARQLLLTLGASVVAAAPFLYRAITLFDDAQVTFAPAFFPIPLVMMQRIGLRDWFLSRAAAVGLTGASQTAFAAAIAAPVFLIGSIGFRLVGLPSLWSCLRHPSRHDPIWRLLAWTVIAALLAATVIVSVPYHETTQIHQFALFLLAVFAGKGLSSIRRTALRAVATGLVIAAAIPATLYYLDRKWHDHEHLLVEASAAEGRMAELLRATDPERTVVLHDRPIEPWLPGILSERRSVLSWAGYVRGNEPRRAQIEEFFAGPDQARALEILRALRPTHVVEREHEDRLNPDLRDRLERVYHGGNVTLYRVPADLLPPEH